MYNLVKNAKILHFLFYNNKNSYVFEYFSSLLSIFLACAIKIFSQKNPHQHLRQRVWNVPKFYFFRFPAYFGIGKMRDREGINICEMEMNIMQKTGCQKWLKKNLLDMSLFETTSSSGQKKYIRGKINF